MVHIPFVHKFPVKVVILQKRGNGVTPKFDKARFIKKEDKGRVYELKDKGTDTCPVSYKYIRNTDDGNPIIFLYEYERNNFSPIKANPEDETLDFEPIDEADQQWLQYTEAMADELHEKDIPWYQKYQSFIAMAFTMIAMIAIAYIFMNQISTTGANLVEALSSAAEAGGAAPG